MIKHLRGRHADTITENQANIILKVCERPITTFDFSACPLCSEWNSLHTDEAHAKPFFRHLARHQQQIALEALPLYVDGLEIRDSEIQEPSSQSGSSSEQESDDEEAKDTPISKAVSGVALDELYARNGLAIPMVVYQCMTVVDLFGLDTWDIHTAPGSFEAIKALKNDFDNAKTVSANPDFRRPPNFYHDVHNAAGLLKEYLRLLPDPLLTRQFHSDLISAVQLDDTLVRRDSIHAIINQLTDPHYATMRALTFHL